MPCNNTQHPSLYSPYLPYLPYRLGVRFSDLESCEPHGVLYRFGSYIAGHRCSAFAEIYFHGLGTFEC